MMTDNRSDLHLVVFTRYPEPGKVKTRLAADTSPTIACDVFGTIVEHLCHNARSCKAFSRIYLCSTDADDALRFGEWLGPGYSYLVQRGDDIGARMKNAIEDVFASGAGGVVLIGSDLPSLDCIVLSEAADALHNHQFCIGPAMDGGYYCIGMKEYYPGVFKGIDWSTDSVFTRTITRIIGLNKKNDPELCKVLPPLHDIDTVYDLETWYRQQPGDSSHPLVAYIQREDLVARYFTLSHHQESL